MRIALDTNRYRDLCEGDPKVLKVLQQCEQVAMPVPVIAELRSGFACGTRSLRNDATLTRFLNESRVCILNIDESTTSFFARLYKQLREQGTPIPTNDLWIAALVEQHRLLLYTRDRHFKNLPQLALIE